MMLPTGCGVPRMGYTCRRAISSGVAARVCRGALDSALSPDFVELFDIVKVSSRDLTVVLRRLAASRSKSCEFQSQPQQVAT